MQQLKENILGGYLLGCGVYVAVDVLFYLIDKVFGQ